MAGKGGAERTIGVSVIVPLLNEEAATQPLLRHLVALHAEQVVIVDGGSSDNTRRIMLDAGYQVIDSPAGRAGQMNAGAKYATQEILLFLHADTELPQNYKSELAKANVWGRFDVRFDSASKSMAMIAFFINLRSRISGVATGDQAIFVDRDVFASIGGYPDFPLMEDVALCKRLRQLHRPFSSRARATTSARRWEQNGVINTIVMMWWYRFAYFLGVSPTKLKQGYTDVR